MALYQNTQKFAFAVLDTGATPTDLISEGKRLDLVFLNVIRKEHPHIAAYIKNLLYNWEHLSNTVLVHIRQHRSSVIASTFSEALRLCSVILPGLVSQQYDLLHI